MTKVLCIFHADCADGLGAAWAVHHALGPDVEFVAARYGDNSPPQSEMENEWNFYSLYRGKDVLIVDFSYPLEALYNIAAEARSVLVLDHHKTAQDDLQGLDTAMTWAEWQKNPLIADENGIRNLAAIFDIERSGAGITWDYLHPNEVSYEKRETVRSLRPHIINLIEDRDLWKFKFGDETQAFHAVMASYNWTDLPGMFKRLDNWNKWCEREEGLGLRWAALINEGEAILRAQHHAVANAVRASRRTIRIAGHVVPVANVPPSMASDVGELLCQGEAIAVHADQLGKEGYVPAFSATYYDGADGKRHFSLRSPEGGADVGQVAKQTVGLFNDYANAALPYVAIEKYRGQVWTGGGHLHAAGFDAPLGWEGE